MNRIAYKDVAPNAYRALLALEGHIRSPASITR
jgi:hypothetical protein